jgi:hypothetical protein
MLVYYFQTVKDLWVYILFIALVALSIYFIFIGKELLGIALLILSALLDYQVKRTKKNNNSHQPCKP